MKHEIPTPPPDSSICHPELDEGSLSLSCFLDDDAPIAVEGSDWLRVSCMINSSRVMENQFRIEDQRRAALTESEKKKILGIDPSFQEITKATYFDNYDLPCPIKVEVETKENTSRVVVLRKTRHGNVEVEARMFRALKEYGLPVPEILSGPFRNGSVYITQGMKANELCHNSYSNLGSQPITVGAFRKSDFHVTREIFVPDSMPTRSISGKGGFCGRRINFF